MAPMTVMSAEWIGALMSRLAGFRDRTQRAPVPGNGWHRAGYDMAELLACFPSLALRSGFELVAWHYSAGGNGAGKAVVIPRGARVPELPAEPRSPFPVDRLPPGSSLAAWTFIEPAGEPTDETYVEMSFLLRHLLELMPSWHDVQFHREVLVAEDPQLELAPGTPQPVSWRPRVVRDEAGAEVVFYTLSFGTLREYRDRWSRALELRPTPELLHAGMNSTCISGSGQMRPP